MSIFSDIQAAGLSIHREIAGEAISYHRGEDSIAITAAVPLGGIRIEDREQGLVLQTEEQEWGIDRNELVLGEGEDVIEIQPERGDLIEWTWKGRTLKFKVLPTSATQCWKWSDRGQSQYRVFTKLIEVT